MRLLRVMLIGLLALVVLLALGACAYLKHPKFGTYGPHFAEIARRFGGFDLVVLDMGQYDARWPDIHMTQEKAARAAVELQTKVLLPAHVGRFNIARHAWDEPFERISAASNGKPFRLVTPMIGEPLKLDDEGLRFSRWRDGAKPMAIPSEQGRDP
jgi:hypothetical protein